jgi:hypothetical protein
VPARERSAILGNHEETRQSRLPCDWATTAGGRYDQQ